MAGCSSGGGAAGPSTTSSVPSTGTRAAPQGWLVDVSPLLGRPSAVAVADDVVWVADDGRGVVERLDANDGHALGDAVEVSSSPVALAVAEGVVWVADSQGTVAPIDATTGTVGAPIGVGGTLVDIVVDGPTVWVADIERSIVIPIDRESRLPGEPISVPFGVVRLATSATRLWVTNLDSSVTAVDLATRAVERSITVGSTPIGLAIHDGLVWVANSDDGTVTRIDEPTGEPVGEPIGVGAAPVAIQIVGNDVWVLEQDGRALSRLDAATGRLELRSGDVGTRPRGIAAADSGLWIVGVDPSAAVLVPPPDR